ncbi:MAG: 50S ribosomal protein L30e [Candidatus Micrarchaeia archaeon]
MASKKSKAEITKSDSASISKAIRMCVDTGKVEFGIKAAARHVLHGQGKLVVVSSNSPQEETADLTKYASLSQVRVYVSELDSLALGSLCGKPFPVSALWIGEVGDSPILDILKQ